MKTKFFLCMRPPVIETDDVDYIKLSPTVGSSYKTVSGNSSGRRNRDIRQGKKVAPEKDIGELSIKSNGNTSESKLENGKQVQKDSKKAEKILKSFLDEESVSLKKMSTISNNKVSGGPNSNSGGYIMVSSLFFTMFFGKLFGIFCTLALVCSMYPHRKIDVNNIRISSKKMVVKWPEEGSPEEYKKRVIMAGLLERKNRYNR